MSEDKITAYRRRKDERRKARIDDDIVAKWRRRKDERQKANAYYAYKKRRADRKKMREDAKWITIGANPGDERQGIPASKGRHVLIDDEGKVVSGAGGSMTGVVLGGATSTSGEVKVDPGKTSDPKPTSPAGAEGKSAGEVAAESGETSKAGGAEKTGGEKPVEPKSAEGKEWAEPKDFEAALKSKEALTEWMEKALSGTEIRLEDDDEYGVTLTKGAGDTWFVQSDDWDEENETFDTFEKAAESLLEGLKSLGNYTVTHAWSGKTAHGKYGEEKGEEPKEEKPSESKISITDAVSAAKSGDVDTWKKFVEEAPIGTEVEMANGLVYKKTGEGGDDGWHAVFKGAEGSGFDIKPVWSAAEMMKGLSLGAFAQVKGPDGEVVKFGKPGDGFSDEPGEEPKEEPFKFEDISDVVNDKDKLSGWMEKCPNGTEVSIGAPGDAIWKFTKDVDGTWTVDGALDHEDFLDASSAASWFIDELDDGKWFAVNAENGEVTKGEPKGPEPIDDEEIGKLKDALSSGDFGAWNDWTEKAAKGTQIVYTDKGGNTVTLENVGGGWANADTGEVADENATFTSAVDMEDFVNFIVDTMGIIDPATGEYHSLVGEIGPKSGEAEGEEPDKPYEAKTDLRSAITGRDKETISSRLKEMKEGTVITLSGGYAPHRYTKNADGTWQHVIEFPSGDYDKGKSGVSDLTNVLQGYPKFFLDGKAVESFGGKDNEAMLRLKKGDEIAGEAIGFANENFAATLGNYDGKTYDIVKQGDGTFTIDDGSGKKEISKEQLFRKIKNEDLWIDGGSVTEAGWETSIQDMLKKHYAPIKKSILTSPDISLFKDTMQDIKPRSTFQMRNTDGNGFSVRKYKGGSFIVTEIDASGKEGKKEYFRSNDAGIKKMWDKFNGFAKKGLTFSNDLKPVPYVTPEKKTGGAVAGGAASGYKGPADEKTYAKAEKASGGLSKVTYDDAAFSDGARKAGAVVPASTKGKERVHAAMFPKMKEWWKGLTDKQRSWVRTYTGSYCDTNEPLRGRTYYGSKGGDSHITEKISAIDSALEKSTLDKPMTVTRGISWGALRAMVAHKQSEYSSYGASSVSDYDDSLIGKELTDPSFLSCTGVNAAGFSSKPVQLRIFCPAGTKAAYINPISHYGMKLEDSELDSPPSWKSPDSKEFEVLLQRGSKFKVKGLEKKDGKLFLDVDLIEQNPRKLSVSGSVGKYEDGKDPYDF